jgi:tetratricopeptide (TPR) repeat protein
LGSHVTRRLLEAMIVIASAVETWWSYHYCMARQHWRQAEAAVESQDAETARQHMAECLRWWSGRFDVRLLAAKIARHTGQLEEAEEHLTYCEGVSGRGSQEEDVLRERALLQVQQGDLPGYLESLAPHGIDDRTLPADVLEALAMGYQKTFDGTGALYCLQRLLELDPNHVRGRVLAGEIYMQTRLYEEAEEQFARAVDQLPHALAPRRNLAECLLELGKVRQAAAHLELLRHGFPDDAGVLYAHAKVLVYRAQIDEAKLVLDQLLARQPRHELALVERGQLEFRHGDPNKALAWLEVAAAVDSSNVEAWEGLGNCYESLAQPEQANKCHEEATRLLRELGEVTRMEMQFMRGNPRSRALLELAVRCERLGLPTRAAGCLLRGVQMDPQHRPTRLALAEFYGRNGQPHLAARQCALAGTGPIRER